MLKLVKRLVTHLTPRRRVEPRRKEVPDMPADPKELARALFANDRKRPVRAKAQEGAAQE